MVTIGACAAPRALIKRIHKQNAAGLSVSDALDLMARTVEQQAREPESLGRPPPEFSRDEALAAVNVDLFGLTAERNAAVVLAQTKN